MARLKKITTQDMSVEQILPQQEHNFDDFHHCFRCGWSKEHGAQLAIVKQEKLCQKCRAQ